MCAYTKILFYNPDMRDPLDPPRYGAIYVSGAVAVFGEKKSTDIFVRPRIRHVRTICIVDTRS